MNIGKMVLKAFNTLLHFHPHHHQLLFNLLVRLQPGGRKRKLMILNSVKRQTDQKMNFSLPGGNEDQPVGWGKEELKKTMYGRGLHSVRQEKVRIPVCLTSPPDGIEFCSVKPKRPKNCDIPKAAFCRFPWGHKIKQSDINGGSVFRFPSSLSPYPRYHISIISLPG